ncbi:ribonuclease H-like domain-containing protein [Brevibacillus parabrevis]|uniref:ribonuclease H-like domain-containing protein n=1 Tax=Brevibacillus parabrevis TaxID=54914 RepID=UPI002E24DF1B|nr:ribonuclease H-like domain-containing protein [Brevibacillus parabrevis]
MSLKSKLQRMKGHMALDSEKRASPAAARAVEEVRGQTAAGLAAEAGGAGAFQTAEALAKAGGALEAVEVSAEAGGVLETAEVSAKAGGALEAVGVSGEAGGVLETADVLIKAPGAPKTSEVSAETIGVFVAAEASPEVTAPSPADSESLSAIPAQAGKPPIPFADRWSRMQAFPYFWEDEHVMIREVRYPIGQRHGAYTFSQLNEAIAIWEASGREHPLSAAGKKADELLFFDTETTGLSGGVGNAVFLLGYSRLEGEEVIVRQHFLPAPYAEATLYQSFLEQAQKSSHLVTFNGKSFDWPQVRTRHTLVRDQVPALPTFGHLDLLHGARRLWKAELESCRLGIIEQEKLDVFREDDLPGFLAPVRYFDFLHSQDPDVIEGVLRHNETDVLSLITLYIHMTRLLADQPSSDVSVAERFEIARWYDALGDQEAAMAGYRLVADSDHVWSNRAKLAIGHLYKKQKNWQQALTVWEACIASSGYVPEEVYIEAAKLCEHQLGDAEKALRYTRQAYEQWKKRGTLLRNRTQSEAAAYQKRIDRLQAKVQGSAAEQESLLSGFLDWSDEREEM